jgi:hypothetical protein
VRIATARSYGDAAFDLLRLDPGYLGDLVDGRLPAEPGHELTLGPPDSVELLDDVYRNPDVRALSASARAIACRIHHMA